MGSAPTGPEHPAGDLAGSRPHDVLEGGRRDDVVHEVAPLGMRGVTPGRTLAGGGRRLRLLLRLLLGRAGLELGGQLRVLGRVDDVGGPAAQTTFGFDLATGSEAKVIAKPKMPRASFPSTRPMNAESSEL